MKMARHQTPEPCPWQEWEVVAWASHRCVPRYAYRRRAKWASGDQISVPCYKLTQREQELDRSADQLLWVDWASHLATEPSGSPDRIAIRSTLLRLADERQCSWCPGFSHEHVEAAVASVPDSVPESRPSARPTSAEADVVAADLAEDITNVTQEIGLLPDMATRIEVALAWLDLAVLRGQAVEPLHWPIYNEQVRAGWREIKTALISGSPLPRGFASLERNRLSKLTRPHASATRAGVRKAVKPRLH